MSGKSRPDQLREILNKDNANLIVINWRRNHESVLNQDNFTGAYINKRIYTVGKVRGERTQLESIRVRTYRPQPFKLRRKNYVPISKNKTKRYSEEGSLSKTALRIEIQSFS